MAILDDISAALQQGRAKDVKELVQQGIDQGIKAQSILHDGLLAGMTVLTTTMFEMKAVIDALKEAGMRERVKVMIGGAPVTEAFRATIGADSYGVDATTASENAVALLNRAAA